VIAKEKEIAKIRAEIEMQNQARIRAEKKSLEEAKKRIEAEEKAK
jgi:hypothetical protein